jgi:hypothetical protein
MKSLWASISAVMILFLAFCILKDRSWGGPHHDEVIGLLAAGAREGAYAQMLAEGGQPLHREVAAAEWHSFTHLQGDASFAKIRWDVMHGDKHPPLAFWLMNLWSHLFSSAAYSQVVWLIMLQVLLTGIVLGVIVWRYTSDWNSVALAFALFLLGNSAVFTAVWVRQYGLFVFCYAGLVAVSGELVRRHIPAKQNLFLLSILASSCLAGMMTQYTFLTMSLPIHLMLVGILILQKNWRQLGLVVGSYLAAGLAFFGLMPGAIKHATEVSGGQNLQSQLMEALTGLPRMLIPLPSNLPDIVKVVAGIVALVLPVLLAVLACRRGAWTSDRTRPDARVPLAGMLGAGVLQFVMVAVGLFPGWATCENHMCSFWLLTVFAAILCLKEWPGGTLKRCTVAMCFTGMIAMQLLFTWHCHRILPRVNTSYIQSQPHDLVAVDNLARGFVLQITDVVPANEKVLATDSVKLSSRLEDGSLNHYRKILYLPMDNSVREGKPRVISAAERSGWSVKELQVVHTGMYEAIVLERHEN